MVKPATLNRVKFKLRYRHGTTGRKADVMCRTWDVTKSELCLFLWTGWAWFKEIKIGHSSFRDRTDQKGTTSYRPRMVLGIEWNSCSHCVSATCQVSFAPVLDLWGLIIKVTALLISFPCDFARNVLTQGNGYIVIISLGHSSHHLDYFLFVS